MKTLATLKEQKKELQQKLDGLTIKYGLKATLEQQKEVIEVGENLENVENEIAIMEKQK